MAEDTTIVAGAKSQPEMVTINLNNREITVTKEAADILKEEEHNLKSGYDAKLRDERAAMQAEQDKHDAAFTEDIEWYNTHPQADWKFYENKVDGGKGYTGTTSPATVSNVPITSTPTVSAFNTTDPKVASLERELKELKEAVGQVTESTIRSGVEQVQSIRDSLRSKYPLANIHGINYELDNYYITHGKTHAPPAEIERIVKAEHAKGEKVARTFMQGKTVASVSGSTLPGVGGTAPAATPSKSLDISKEDDLDTIIKRGEEFLIDGGYFPAGR